MSGRVRFSSARQIFESFPTAAGDIEGRPLDETPLDFARTLISKGKRFEAIAFSAYLLPRREAVWWGCQCLRALGAAGDNIALAASEAWVRDPEDSTRRAALECWTGGDRKTPSTWLAFAAAYSGGSVAPTDRPPRAPQPHMTSIGVKVALVLAIAAKPPRLQGGWIAACAQACIRFAEGGECKLHPPGER